MCGIVANGTKVEIPQLQEEQYSVLVQKTVMIYKQTDTITNEWGKQ